MNVTLYKFMKYNDKITFPFESGKIIHATGSNGIGKTTVFEAITWCLYGGRYENLYPYQIESTKKDPTYVIVEINGVKIKRIKPPELISVKFEDSELCGKPAEEYIENTFGTKKVFLTCCFIRNSNLELLTATNEHRYTILKELTFGNDTVDYDTPNHYFSKTNEELIISRDKLKHLSGKFNGQYEFYNKKLEKMSKSIKIWGDRDINNNQLKILKNELNEIKIDIKEYTKVLNLKIKIDNLNQTKRKKKKKITKLNELLSNINIDSLIKKRDKYKEILSYFNELKLYNVNDIIEKFDLDNNSPNDILNELYSIKHQHELLIQDNIDVNQIPKLIKEYQEKINSYNIWLDESINIENINKNIINNYNNEYNLECEKIKNKNIEIENSINLAKIYNEKLDNDYKLLIAQWKNECELLEKNYISNKELNDIKIKNNLELERIYNKEVIKNKEKIDNENKRIKDEFNRIKLENDEKNKRNLNLKKNYEKILKHQENAKNEYNQQVINSNNIYEKELIKYKEYISIKEKNEKIEKNIDRDFWFNISKKDLTIQNINEEIVKYKLELQEIICPHCDKGLIIKNGIPCKGKLDLILKDKIENNILKLNKLINDLNQIKEVKEIKNPILNEITEPIFESIDIPLYEELNNINEPIYLSYDIIEKPIYEEIKPLKKLCLPDEPEDEEIRKKTNLKLLEIPIYQQPKLKTLIEPNFNINEIKEKLNKLRNYIIPIYSLEEINNYLDKFNKYPRYLELKEKTKNVKILNIDLLEQEINDYNNNKIEIDILTKEIDVIKNDIEKLNKNDIELNTKYLDRECKFEYNDCDNEIILYEQHIEKLEIVKKNIEKLINAGKDMLFLEETRQGLEEINDEIKLESKRESNLILIKELVNTTTTNSMNDVLTSINNFANDVLSVMLKEKITVILDTHFTTKTTKTEKLKVNLHIYYKGMVYNNINCVSGGEREKIKFALILAISKINNCSMLLLDECFNAFDKDSRNDPIEVLRNKYSEYLKKLVIINVGHNLISGHHDIVFNLDKHLAGKF